jgi:pantetheine-phosphate adenylyltransferase
MKTAIYPGSFDPITKGHIDIIERTAKIFDKVVVGVLINKRKEPMFNLEERVDLVKKSLDGIDNVIVDSFEGLLIDYITKHDIGVIVKGLRAVSDFENELQMASMNRALCNDVETFFLMTDTEYAYLSSSLVKEVFALGGDIQKFVTQPVLEKMISKKR